jgi:serine/threonine protein kinase
MAESARLQKPMPLGPGTRVGPYEIVSAIGAGGMGEVYRARDPRLGRDVAIKVLPAAFSTDSERLQRFEQEARAAAALNHPNILAVYDIGTHEGAPYIVSELLEGETLRERLKGQALPVRKAIEYAIHVAHGLSAAHARGIVHRDLKPENLFLTSDGRVKILDFGLAKLTQSEPMLAGMSALPTTPPDTLPGVVLGTIGYMAPEQVRGLQADHRADLFAFGAILYEMLSGRRAFPGDTAIDTMTAVLKEDPPDLPVAHHIPPALERIVDRCLEKNPGNRFQSAGDLAFALEGATSPSSDTVVGTDQPRVHPWRERLAWTITTVLVIAIAALYFNPSPAARPVDRALVRLDLDLPLGDSSTLSLGPNAILSPDGTRLVYVSNNRLATRRLDQLLGNELPGTEGASSPFFSPDGQWVGFFGGGKLRKISVAGGAAIPLTDAPGPYGGSWGPDDTIIAKLRSADGLEQISAIGGTPVAVTTLLPGERDHNWPQILPGGKAVLFSANTRVGGWDGATIEVMSLNDRQRKTLVRGGTFGRYLPSGHLIYVNSGTLFAVPFDLDTLALSGTPVPVLNDVTYSSANGGAQLDVSTTGVVVYQSGSPAELFTVAWVDRAGRLQPLLAKPDTYVGPRFSAGGTRLAVALNGDVWIFGFPRDVRTRVTFEGGGYPTWSPDGEHVVVSAGQKGMAWTRADGSGKPQLLTDSANNQWPWSFTPDGRRLAFQERNPGTGWDIWTVPIESTDGALRAGRPEVFLQTMFDEGKPSFSPDGRWIAYSSNESGTEEVDVRAFPDTGARWQVSRGGGKQPVWSRSGKELLFRGSDGRIMAASYQVTASSFTFDTPQAWSETRLANVNINGTYDIAPDGKRIAALIPAEVAADRGRSHIVYLDHFFDELRRLAHTKQ